MADPEEIWQRRTNNCGCLYDPDRLLPRAYPPSSVSGKSLARRYVL
jgi:hypothetical protein